MFVSFPIRGNWNILQFRTKPALTRSPGLTLFSLGGGGEGHIVPALTLTNYNF